MAEWHRANCLSAFLAQRNGIVKIGDVIHDAEYPEDVGIIVKIKGDGYLIIELKTGRADWYDAEYVDSCYVVQCE